MTTIGKGGEKKKEGILAEAFSNGTNERERDCIYALCVSGTTMTVRLGIIYVYNTHSPEPCIKYIHCSCIYSRLFPCSRWSFVFTIPQNRPTTHQITHTRSQNLGSGTQRAAHCV